MTKYRDMEKHPEIPEDYLEGVEMRVTRQEREEAAENCEKKDAAVQEEIARRNAVYAARLNSGGCAVYAIVIVAVLLAIL